MMQYTVTIEKHLGKGCFSGDVVDLGQYRIRINGKTAGYVKHGGGPVNLIKRMPPEMVEDVKGQVQELIKAEVSKVAMPPVVPPELREEEDYADDIDS